MSTATAEAISNELVPTEAVPTEAELRIQLAAAYRLVEHFGWNESIYGHLTVRVPGPERHFLINPYGLRYGEVTASNLVKITLEGAIVGETAWSVNVAGYAIHGAIHKGAAEAHCVMHTHSPAGMAVAALECGLLPISLDATLFHGTVGYHAYEGAVVSDAEKARLVHDLGQQPRPHPPQPRPRHRRPHHRGSLPLPAPAGDRLQDAGRRPRHEQHAQPRAGRGVREVGARDRRLLPARDRHRRP